MTPDPESLDTFIRRMVREELAAAGLIGRWVPDTEGESVVARFEPAPNKQPQNLRFFGVVFRAGYALASAHSVESNMMAHYFATPKVIQSIVDDFIAEQKAGSYQVYNSQDGDDPRILALRFEDVSRIN